jgi:poly-gamma-glutamate capsule biosynthesis protein CapA/YwtB (metallophosphatase superfamily)
LGWRVRSSWRLFLGFALIALNSSAAVASERGAGGSIAVANAPLAGPREPILNSDSSGERGATRAIERPSDDGVVTIVLGGDLGLGGSNQPVDATGAFRHGQKQDWHELTSGIAPLFDGDINFANLETVVTDRNDLRANPKSFNFKSHPAGVHHLARLGLSAVSTANNHAIDYGQTGVRETLRHLEGAAVHGLAAWPGLGVGRDEASRPADITVDSARVRISAIGIGGGVIPAGEPNGSRPSAGMLSYNSAEDFKETVARLKEAAGDLRILSVHYGAELQVRASLGDVAKLRDQAAKDGGIDIVVGHHAHVAAGVQLVDGNLVFYGLGNLLHPGMQNMGRFGVCRDYGLVVRVFFSRDAIGKLTPRAIEAMPITDMHARAKPLIGEAGRLRVEVLNYLAAELDDEKAGATGVRFASRADGSGLYCLPGAAQEPGHIGATCEGWEPPPPSSRDIARRIAASCSGALIARRRSEPDGAAIVGPARNRVSRQKPKVGSGSALLTSIFGW